MTAKARMSVGSARDDRRWILFEDGTVAPLEVTASPSSSNDASRSVVQHDPHGRFARIQRQYHVPGRTGDAPVVCVTSDVSLVQRWACPTTHALARSFIAPDGVGAATEIRSIPGKRLFDIALSVVGLVLLAPLVPVIMLLIWIDDGRPFFFVHRRQTLGGREFNCVKFRTMYRDADARLAEVSRLNACDGPQYNIPNDPRLLRCGTFLRRWCLDEIPQLWNIFRGEMSFVGPRPSPSEENQYATAWRIARTSVRPGLTGLWQVCRTREPMLDFQEWIRYDTLYVNRRSWRLDLWILCATVRVLVLGSSARYE